MKGLELVGLEEELSSILMTPILRIPQYLKLMEESLIQVIFVFNTEFSNKSKWMQFWWCRYCILCSL